VPIELPIGSIITSLKIYISEKEASDGVVFGISEVARGSIGQPWGAGVVDFSTVTTAGEHVHNGDDVPILEDFRYGVLIACTGATETVGVSQVEITYHKPIIAVPAP
jgi:hypothetical protein